MTKKKNDMLMFSVNDDVPQSIFWAPNSHFEIVV